ncbi:MAG TPA: proline iminopeptidase-family hydrolase [Patescibacteria group bacterium]|nr:proline iminopeptidase-family hydrolase [Patescibacteria group bacterium]
MKRRNEGFITTSAGKVWYEIVGQPNKIPLITVHGGPGYPHDYLEPFEDLSDERQVVFYDQLGCGNSGWPQDKSYFSLEYCTDELAQLIKDLGFKEYHLIGQSWGTTIAANLAIRKPEGLKSAIFAGVFFSSQRWLKDAWMLIEKLPEDARDAFKNSDHNSAEYKKALELFNFKYLYMIKPEDYPTEIIKAENKTSPDILEIAYGSDEFHPSGILDDLDLTDKLSEINVPTLFLAGRNDYSTPETTEYFASHILGSEVKIFEKSAHFAHWTEREEFISTIRQFLTKSG